MAARFRVAISTRGPKLVRSELVGLGHDGGADYMPGATELERVADLELQLLEQDRFDRDAAVFAEQNVRQRLVAIELNLTDERIVRIDTLDLDQRLLGSVRPTCHRPHARLFVVAAGGGDPYTFGIGGADMWSRQRYVAAEKGRALPLETGAHGIAEGRHGGDHRDAERDAGDENPEAMAAGADLAQRER